MTEELAHIVAIEKNTLLLRSHIKTTCGSCAQIDTCASGQVSKALPKRQRTYTVPFVSQEAIPDLTVGDDVVVEIPEGTMLSSAGQVYLLPITGLIFFSALGQWLVDNHIFTHELYALNLGIVGGYLGYCLAKYRQKHNDHACKLQPQIVKKLLAKPSQCP